MKKIIISLSIIIIILLSVLIYINIDINNTGDKENKKSKYDAVTLSKLKKLDMVNERINYFNFDLIDRYINYKNSNPDFDVIDVITKVNIGLDYKFYENTKEVTNYNSIDILVNKYNYLKSDYIPNNLVEINREYSNGSKVLVDVAAKAFEKMAEDAKNLGYTIRAVSTYRSYEYQNGLYTNYSKKDGIEKADTYSARAGYSEHQTGLAVDVDNEKINYTKFSKTEEYKWLINNSYKYGFILRYPENREDITGYSYENWHYRYVGNDAAKYIYNNGITYDEYIAKK